jgi:serine/threonine protein kinase/tetratricopeptide (TPR) repeat protein
MFVSTVEPVAPRFPGYRTEHILGRGGFGTVYAARAEIGGARAAIKLARAGMPEAAARLVRETAVLSAIGPPHVPALLGSGTLDSGTPYLVMELIGAPTLAEGMLARAGPLPAHEAARIAMAALRSLEGVHAAGYVHRDLKPENILVDALGERAVLVDFGLARHAPLRRAGLVSLPLVSSQSMLASATVQGAIVGTTEYMSPEQCEGLPDVDARVDIYAMGIILFEMLTGRTPFFGPAALVREGHSSQRPPRPGAVLQEPFAAISTALEDVVLRCLAKDPDERFPSASSLRAALAAASAVPVRRSLRVNVTPTLDLPPNARTPAVISERRMVSLLCFESPLDGIALRRWVEPLGAQVVHAAAGRHVIAFGHEVDENPARKALEAARDLVARGACERVAVDLATVIVRTGPDGARRIIAPRIAREGRFPLPTDPPGVVLSDAARAVLETAGVTPVPSAPEGGPEEQTPAELLVSPPSSRANPLPIVGREDLVDALVEAARRAAEERLPTIAVVVAEAGHGKSALRRALAARLRDAVPSGFVLDLGAHEPVGGALGPSLRELLQRALALPAVRPENGGRALLEAWLGPERYAEGGGPMALSLGWIAQGEGDADAARSLATLEAAPGAIRTLLTVTAGEALRRRAFEGPLLVILDDAHFTEDATLEILEHAALAEAGAPMFVCALGRPSFVEDRPAFGVRAGSRAVYRMEPLDAASATALCRELLRPAENVPESALARIVARAQYVPLLIVELVRGLKAEGIVRQNPSGGGFFLATDELDRVPDLPLIEWLAHRELDALPSSARAHARLVAVLGAEVTIAEMEGVLRRLDRSGEGADFPLDARVGTERLVAAGVLSRPRGERYGFRHALVREAIARSVPEGLRRAVHLAAVGHYQSSMRPGDEGSLAQLAHHAEHAGEHALAEGAYVALAEASRARHDYLDAERFYTRVLDQSPDAARRGPSALRGRGLMRYRIGRYPDALGDFALAREAARASGDVLGEAQILLDEATALDWLGDYEASRERVTLAQALPLGDAVPPALEARLLLGMGRSLHRFCREEEAASLLGRALSVAEGLGEEAYETRIISLLLLGFILQGLARLSEASDALDRVVALCEAHGDRLHLAGAFNNRALLLALGGDKERMVADFERVLALGRELGQDSIEVMGHYNLGEYLYLWDDLAGAKPHVERALAIEERRTGGEPRAVIELLGARLDLHCGHLEAARSRGRQIRARAGGALPVPAEDVLCAMVELVTAEGSELQWQALEARSAEFSIGQERIEVIEARAIAAYRAGRVDEARGHLERAIEAAKTIPNVMSTRLTRRMEEILREGAGRGQDR